MSLLRKVDLTVRWPSEVREWRCGRDAQLVPRGEFGRLPVGPVPFGPATDMVGEHEHVALKP
jgi:hypothetical protein